MRQEGLVACQPRPKARTTVPAADLAGRPDLIERDFTADAPARKLVCDITYIHTREGFVALHRRRWVGGSCVSGRGWRGVVRGGGAMRGSSGWQDEGVYASSETQGPLCETLPHHALTRSAGLIGSG